MAGVTDNTTCPYCGNIYAIENWESRGPGRGTSEFCDICGWQNYEPKEDYVEYEQDGYKAGEFPPDESIIPKAKQVANWLKMIGETDYDWDELFIELVHAGGIPEYIKNNTVEKNFVKALFNDY